MTISRRTVLKGAAATATLATPAFIRNAFAEDPIKLGTVFDISGIFDAYGKPIDMAVRLAIKHINDAGGLLGRQVQHIGYDTQSDMALYTQYAQQLTRQDKVDVVHGGILSASREAIRQTLRKAGTLYFYNIEYEGGVCDANCYCTGVTPAQTTEVQIPYTMEKWGKKVYILAADYNYGQLMARWIQKYFKDNGGETLAVEFFPLDVADFGSTITKIQTAAPDMVYSALVGGAHLSFYRQWAAAGMKSRIPLASTTLGVGSEHLVLTPEEGDGIVVCYNYSPELDTPANKAFTAAWGEVYGANTVPNIHELAVSNYQGVMLWAEAVKAAGSVENAKVRAVLDGGLAYEGPAGMVTIDPKTHHATLDVHLMEMKGQKLNVIKSFGARQPIDTQLVCDLVANPDDNQQYEIKI
ncbi:MAG: transporter substrate-binding protein [Rhizobiaceae bacterium]|nr:MAG: transporter substrate-binding protein [Rhizobiaceae bacterium]CAG0996991.1 Aliphatic amidase expression-regulating protein [Rhizobiaceae bacterium]